MKRIFMASLIALVAITMLGSVALAQPNLGLNEFGGQTQLGTKTLTETVASILNVAFGLLGMLAVLLILFAGFLWMTAAGDEQKISKAKSLIFGGIIGLAIILSAYAIASFVVGSLLSATS